MLHPEGEGKKGADFMKKSKNVWGVLLAAVLIAVSLSGCGGTPADSAKTQNQGGGSQGEAADAAGSKKDTLTVALTGEPPSLTTCDHDSIISVYMNLLTYNGLMRIDNETLDVVPDLAAEYHVENDTDWYFTLKDGIKFHNGESCTAADVAASIEWAKTFPGSSNYTKNIQSVEAVDDKTVKIVTQKPYAGLLADLAYHFNFVVPKDLIESGHDFNADPVGTGPYQFVSWQYGDSLTFKAFDDYFDRDRKAKIPNLVFKIIPEGTSRTIALEAGEVDFVYEVPTADVDRLKSDHKYTLKEITSVENFFLALNLNVKPFDDVNVRQAINYGINREDLITAALNGYGVPSYTAIAKGYDGFTDQDAARYSEEKAKEYLSKWGGDPTSIVLPIICSNETKIAAATVIQSNLAKLGIKVEIVSMDTATYFSSWEAGNWTGLISSWSPSNSLTYVQRYHSDRAKTYPGTLQNSEIDGLVKDAETTLDKDARIKKIENIVVQINHLAPQISLYQPLMFRAYDADLQGVTAGATGYVDFNTMYWK